MAECYQNKQNGGGGCLGNCIKVDGWDYLRNSRRNGWGRKGRCHYVATGILVLAYCMEENFFNNRAKSWAATRRSDPHLLAELIRVADVRSGMRVLDVGCGAGVLSPILSTSVGAGGVVVGVDASWAMVEEARRLHVRLARVAYLYADVEREVSPLGRFDRIVMLDVWPHLATPIDTVRRLVGEALLPNGRLLVAHDIGRDAVNRLHAACGLSETSFLPPAAEVVTAVEAVGLRVLAWRDDETCYYLLLAA